MCYDFKEEKMKYDNLSMPLGVHEIAKLLNVKPDTVSSWQLRKIFPKPDAYINDNNTRVWKLQTVFDWARSTGRNNRKFRNYGDAGEFMVKSSLFNGHNAGSEARTSNPTNTDDTLNYAQNIGSYNAQELN
tara:strand:- start:131 stop:523 length:393 start_codon:yes stop_codon:yes gene_type:complete